MRRAGSTARRTLGALAGGAICQIVIANHPGRIGRLVLTNCDAYEAFFPVLLKPFHYGARFLGTRFTDLLAWSLRARPVATPRSDTVGSGRAPRPRLGYERAHEGYMGPDEGKETAVDVAIGR